MDPSTKLERIYEVLFQRWGWAGWWPADDTFEIIIGAILTQNTAWKNVERAIGSLRGRGLLDAARMRGAEPSLLATAIKPAGYYNLKAKRLGNFLDFLFREYGGSLENMFMEDTLTLREKLLAVNGLGPETVDSILLYAGGKPIFVIDRYTVRIMARHGLLPEDTDYASAQEFFMSHLPEDERLFNNFHALLVRVGNRYCRRRPECEDCPLSFFEDKYIDREYLK